MFGILVSLYYTVHRVMGVRLHSFLSILLALTLTGFFLCHISYLTFYRFDYGYNIKASITVAVIHSILWIYWVAANYFKRAYAWKMGLVVLSLTSAMSLEILDFPPFLRIFDAHSLWHLATIPIVRLMWDFTIDDTIFEVLVAKIDPQQQRQVPNLILWSLIIALTKLFLHLFNLYRLFNYFIYLAAVLSNQPRQKA